MRHDDFVGRVLTRLTRVMRHDDFVARVLTRLTRVARHQAAHDQPDDRLGARRASVAAHRNHTNNKARSAGLVRQWAMG